MVGALVWETHVCFPAPPQPACVTAGESLSRSPVVLEIAAWLSCLGLEESPRHRGGSGPLAVETDSLFSLRWESGQVSGGSSPQV